MVFLDFLLPKNEKNIYSNSSGFDFNYLSDNFVYIRNRYYTNSNIENMLKILIECATLINSTKTPKVFFERYLLAISILNELIPIERKIKFKGDKPSQIKKQFQKKETLTVSDFIDRYYQDCIKKINSLKTEKSKQNTIQKFKDTLDNYKEYMQQENIDKYIKLYNNLIK